MHLLVPLQRGFEGFLRGDRRFFEKGVWVDRDSSISCAPLSTSIINWSERLRMLSEKHSIFTMSKHGCYRLGAFRTSGASVIQLQGHGALKSLAGDHRWPGEGSASPSVRGFSTEIISDSLASCQWSCPSPKLQNIQSANAKHINSPFSSLLYA